MMCMKPMYLGPGNVIPGDAARQCEAELRERGVGAQHGGGRTRRLPRDVSERIGPLPLQGRAQGSQGSQHASFGVVDGFLPTFRF